VAPKSIAASKREVRTVPAVRDDTRRPEPERVQVGWLVMVIITMSTGTV
jgi:hypothetical protein